MLQKVEKSFIETVVSIMKGVVGGRLKSLIEAYVADGVSDHIDLYFLPELYIVVDVQTHPDKTIAKTADGELIITRFEVEGAMPHFLAFCLQEGELLYQSECQTCRERSHCPSKSPRFTFNRNDVSGDYDISEWREYIKNKYHIFPPEFDYEGENGASEGINPDDPRICTGFTDLLWECYIEITGGVACPDCLMQYEE